jgi:hypothetical protein
MAKPILATPTLKGKDAEAVRSEMQPNRSISATKKRELSEALKLYRRISARSKKRSKKRVAA